MYDCLDFLAEMDNVAVDWCDDPDFFDTLQSPCPPSPGLATPVPRAESTAWQFVNEEPANEIQSLHTKRKNMKSENALSQKCVRGKACTHCHTKKVVLMSTSKE